MRTVALAFLTALAFLPNIARADEPPAPPLTADEKARFDQAADYSKGYAGHGVLIMRHGQVIYERYDNGWSADKPHPLASGTKSFTGVAAMIAVQEGLFTLDEKVCDTITEWKSDPKKSQITVRHLLTLSSGLQPDSSPSRNGKPATPGAKGIGGVIDRLKADDWFADAVNAPMTGTPGGQFAYGGNHYYAFGEFFQRKMQKAGGEEKAIWTWYSNKLFGPLGMTIGRMGRDNAGHPNLPGGAQLTAREWAKFGQFVLQNGSWKQPDGTMKEILKPELLAQCFEPSKKNPNYGLTWWLKTSGGQSDAEAIKPPTEVADNPSPVVPVIPGEDGTARGKRVAEAIKRLTRERLAGQNANQAAQNEPVLGPDNKPITIRMAAGLGKQRLMVLPQYDMVVVRFADIAALNKGQGFDDRLFLAPILGFDKDGKKLEPAAPSKPAP